MRPDETGRFLASIADALADADMRLFKRNLEPEVEVVKKPFLLVSGCDQLIANETFLTALAPANRELDVQPYSSEPSEEVVDLSMARAALSAFDTPERLSELMNLILEERAKRNDGTPVFIIAVRPEDLRSLGKWLNKRATANQLRGIRLIVAASSAGITEQLEGKLEPIFEPSFLKMPRHTESSEQARGHRLFFSISPETKKNIKFLRELAENKIMRLYLLGGPGTGKTTFAYYFWMRRNKGRFVTVNLKAESTSDKLTMKSLLLGHVPGVQGNEGTREGAFSYARDGVCFLDESHGVTSVMMQVLMEVLDGGQYLSHGSTAKKQLECAVLFASNRSWERLRSEVHLDEHARLGAIRVEIPDLSQREEDMIAVLAHGLHAFTSKWTTWTPPDGLTPAAWQAILDCRWHGNVRTLIRVVETASVKFASERQPGSLLSRETIEESIAVWEPKEHESLELYSRETSDEVRPDNAPGSPAPVELHSADT